MSVETLPEYLSVSQYERGENLGLSSETYFALAKSATSIIRAFSSFMAVYLKRDKEACILDIFPETKDVCLSIHIQQKEGELRLFAAGMDSPDVPTCLLTSANSKEGFEKLQETVKSYLSAA